MIESLLNSRPAWIQLGLVLAHFLWQGAAIAVVLAASLWLLRRGSPNVRYGLCGLAMLTMAVSPILTLWYVRTHPLPIVAVAAPIGSPVVASPDARSASRTGGTEVASERETSGSPVIMVEAESNPGVVTGEGPNSEVRDSGVVPAAVSTSEIARADLSSDPSSRASAGMAMRRLLLARGLQLITVAWCAGVLVLSTRLIVGWWRLRRHCRRETEALPETAEGIVRRLSRCMGLTRPVRVLTTRAWNEPIAFGLLRPVVLLPISVLTQCPVELIEAMIAHELAHIRRYDLWVNMLQRVVETLLFYHPAVWWVSGRMRLERELCCDDLAIQATGRRADYATALVELCRMSPGLVTPAMAAGIFGPKLSLLTRVRRILQVPSQSGESNRGRFWLAGPLSILLAGAFVLVAGLRAAVPGVAAKAQPADASNSVVSGFTATLPDGVTVELLGVGENQLPGERQWWKPDGSPLDIAPYWRTKTSVPGGSLAYDLALRVAGTSDYSVKFVGPAGKPAGGEPWVLPADPPEPYRQLNSLPGLHGFLLAPFKPGDLETSVDAALATGSWQRVDDWTGRPWVKGKPGTHTTRTESGVAFVWPRSEGNATTIQVSHTYTDVATRLVAFDRAGKRFVGTDSHLGSGRGITTRLYTFSGLALQDVNGFEFQQRPYDSWITFKNVSLKPAHRTQVQVETTRGAGNGSPLDTPATTRPAESDRLPAEERSYAFKWERVPLPKVLAELQEKTGLSMSGIEDLGDPVSKVTVSFTSVRPVGFDEALLLVNHLIQDKGPGYWILRGDQCLEIRDVVSWFRRIPPAQMFTTEEAYRKADLPKWDVASVVYQPRHASAKSLAMRAMDGVPDNTARAQPTPDGSRIELKGIVEYIDQQLEIMKKWDVPQDDLATLLMLDKAGEDAGRRYSFYGGRADTPSDQISKLYSKALAAAYSAGLPSVPVHAGADGLIVEVKVKNGQTVKKGDLLARFDDEEIKIDLAAAEIRFDDCSKKHKRLQAQPNVAAEERERVESAMRLAQLDVQRCRLRLDRTQIKSPVDGVVVGRGAPENDVALLANQQVKAGELLLYIQPAEQTGSAGTTAPRKRVAATPKSVLSTRPSDSARLDLLNALRDSPFPLVARDGKVLGLEKAIKEAEAMRDELRLSRPSGTDQQTIMAVQEMIDRMRKLSAQSAKGERVYAQGDGVVAEVKVMDGQMVKKGDRLVRLDTEETELELQAADVRLSQFRMRFEEMQQAKGRFSDEEHRKAEADMKLAEIEFKRIQLRLSRSQILSPADGRVRSAEGNLSDLVGKRVVAGDLLLYVESVDSVSQADTRPSR